MPETEGFDLNSLHIERIQSELVMQSSSVNAKISPAACFIPAFLAYGSPCCFSKTYRKDRLPFLTNSPITSSVRSLELLLTTTTSHVLPAGSACCSRLTKVLKRLDARL